MSSDPTPGPAALPAISVRGVGKRYEVFRSPTDRLRQAVTGRKRGKDFWALKDVSFDVFPGESVGIIGRNGSGKSTLMQIIAGTLAPTTGEVHIRGRIAALLELGSGFNPQFTGRENVVLSGAILGIPKRQMEARLPEIEEFAEIGAFIDEPVGVYSSGMHARLAFAVSVSLRPDILILDEILSVGDAGFQQRCIGRLHSLLTSGVTLLFVSHAADAVKSLCRKGLLLRQGEQQFFGKSREAVELYFAGLREQQSSRAIRRYEELAAAHDGAKRDAEAGERGEAGGEEPNLAETENTAGFDPGADSAPSSLNAHSPPLASPLSSPPAFLPEAVPDNEAPVGLRYGTGHARFESVRILDSAGRERDGFGFGECLTVEATFRAAEAIPKLDVIVKVRDKAGIDLFGVSANEEGPKLLGVAAGAAVRCLFTFTNILRAGPHGVTVTLIRPPRGQGGGVVTLDHIDAAAAFESLPRGEQGRVIRGKFQHRCAVEWGVVDGARPAQAGE